MWEISQSSSAVHSVLPSISIFSACCPPCHVVVLVDFHCCHRLDHWLHLAAFESRSWTITWHTKWYVLNKIFHFIKILDCKWKIILSIVLGPIRFLHSQLTKVVRTQGFQLVGGPKLDEFHVTLRSRNTPQCLGSSLVWSGEKPSVLLFALLLMRKWSYSAQITFSQLNPGNSYSLILPGGGWMVSKYRSQRKTIPLESLQDGSARIRTRKLRDPAATQG